MAVKLTKQTIENLYADLKEVFGLYDLEIFKYDGLWLMKHDYMDAFYLIVRPFEWKPKRASVDRSAEYADRVDRLGVKAASGQRKSRKERNE